MNSGRSRRFGAAGLVLAWTAAGALAQDEAAYRKFLEEMSPSIVTIKCVLKIKAGGQEREVESEGSGVMIDPNGLVLCSNSRLGGAYGLMRRLMGAEMSINPTDIKVIVGDAADGVDAKFVARDTELDLAWIQIKEPGDRKFTHVDLAKSAAPRIGQKVLSVYRTSKNFDRTPVIMESLIGGVARKPRELYLAEDLSAALGLPAFKSDGSVVGVTILQIPDGDESTAQRTLGRLENSNEYNGVLLPVSEVIKATARAREAAETQSEESSDDESATRPAKDDGEKPHDQKDAQEN